MSAARRQLAVAVAVQVLVMSVWFSTAAVVPSLQADWGISSGGASWLTTAVQLGFVVGAVGSALLNLADRIPIGRLIAVASVLAAATTALVPLLSTGLGSAVVFRFLTGAALAGVYPVGAKLVASWFSRSRGLAMGLLLGALTLGSGLPHLVGAFGDLPWHTVLYVTAGLAALGAVIALRLESGPLAAPPAPLQPRYVIEMFRNREERDVNLGYFGHMWELYAFWTWLSVYLSASILHTSGSAPDGTEIGLASFAAIGLAGVAGCVLAGRLALRHDPVGLARAALAASGLCCAASPLVFVAPTAVVIAVALFWGVAVIADSPMFSTALSRVARPAYLGTALTAQMAIGFLVTAVAIRLLPAVAGAVGWQWTFVVLLPGPVLGLAALGGVRPR